jgi:hypothetical protein
MQMQMASPAVAAALRALSILGYCFQPVVSPFIIV